MTISEQTLRFNRLKQAPEMAWPTLGLFCLCMLGFAATYYLALTDAIPMWLGTLISGVLCFYCFTVAHDATHGAVSKNKAINNGLGHIAMFFFGGFASLDVARWIHMQHHRFTNDHDKDPDAYGHSIDLWFPLRWANFDFHYSRYFLNRAGPMRKRLMGSIYIKLSVVLTMIIVGVAFGYGYEILMLWFLPTRISSFLFVAMFVYLPHIPFAATAAEDEYKATNIRQGFEWLLTPVMMYQNYHLLHHLYPSAPFYRYIKLWEMNKEEHMSHQPIFVKAFSLDGVVSSKSK
ncbi:fatty acid desaturase [Oceanicoccus sagamiensis]|uniref:Fatty acid desaturase n=1 Tax=Oceanicoccus sagamiensis TaxID=716816 RepID=A0A1X9N4M1_9GAMM|nr:fatty acid desaturase [Oceanicoccus sagamiensis]ARN73088.1 fatty acid desaturase [Oceanicoccus sagamiensis]